MGLGCGAWVWLPCCLWDISQQGIESVSPALEGRFLTITLPGKFKEKYLLHIFSGWVSTLGHHMHILQVFQYHGKIKILIHILKIVKLKLKEDKNFLKTVHLVGRTPMHPLEMCCPIAATHRGPWPRAFSHKKHRFTIFLYFWHPSELKLQSAFTFKSLTAF